jgi:hypothetical protein
VPHGCSMPSPLARTPTPQVEAEWRRQAQLGPAEHGLRPEHRCPRADRAAGPPLPCGERLTRPGQGSPLFTPGERVRQRPAWTLPALGRRLVVLHLVMGYARGLASQNGIKPQPIDLLSRISDAAEAAGVSPCPAGPDCPGDHRPGAVVRSRSQQGDTMEHGRDNGSGPGGE